VRCDVSDSFEEELVQNSRLYYEAFLPGAVTRLRNQALARVTGVSNNSDSLDGLDKSQLVDVARKFLAEWKLTGGEYDPMLEEAAARSDFRIQAPSAVYVSPFPLVLVCDRCGALENHDKSRRQHENAVEGVYRRVKPIGRSGKQGIFCTEAGCGGRMRQAPYVLVHRCGHLAPISTPPSARGIPNLGFRDGGNLYRLSSFFDLATGHNLAGATVGVCPACTSKATGKSAVAQKGTPVTGGDSFFPQVLQFVALSEKAGNLVSRVNAEVGEVSGALSGRVKDIVEGLAASLLGIADSTKWQSEALLLLDGSPASPEEQVAVKAQRKGLMAEIEQLETLISNGMPFQTSVALARTRLMELDARLGTSGGTFAAVRDLVPSDALLLQLAQQRRTMEAVLLRHDVQRQSVESAVVQNRQGSNSAVVDGDWQFVRNSFGIEDIAHVPDLKVVLSAVGFTREKREPERSEDALPVKLNPFEDQVSPTSRGKAMLYALSAQTEALWIRLDPIKVLRWCVNSVGWEQPSPETFTSRSRAHAYLLQMSSALSEAPTDATKQSADTHFAQAAPFHLMHSICHSLLLSARRHSGYDAQSLTEYLFPMDMSFIIYVTSVQNYTAGGLLMLFQHYLRRWLEDASMFAFNCAFDPICSDVGGACPGCIQTSRGCETFNAGVSRAYLHGGQADQHHNLWVATGYWDRTSTSA
jgi:hypothetical protein